MKYFILILFFGVSYLQGKADAGGDTLNQYNKHHKKNGFWICYLDSTLNPVDSANSFYYGYEKYDNGDQVFRFYPLKYASYYKFEYEGEKPEKGKPILLDGKFKWSYTTGVCTGLVAELQIFSKGRPVYMHSYHRTENDTTADFNEILYFDRKYNGIDGTFYYEETTNIPDHTPGTIVTYCGYFYKDKRKWKTHGTKTKGTWKKYGVWTG